MYAEPDLISMQTKSDEDALSAAEVSVTYGRPDT